MYSCFRDGVAVLNTDIHGCEMTVNTKSEAKKKILDLFVAGAHQHRFCLVHKYTWEEMAHDVWRKLNVKCLWIKNKLKSAKKKKKKKVTIKNMNGNVWERIRMIGGENCLSISFITEKTNLDKNCISETISSQIRSVFSLWIGKKGLAKTKYAGYRRS